MKTTTSLLLVCFSLLVACSMAQPQYQIDALMEFYNSTNGPYWYNNANWGKGLPCYYNWYGVSCDSNDEITKINLSSNKLIGSIPESFGQLSNLRKLYLNTNTVYGSIPRSFANLTSLTDLNLSSNTLTGSFPEVFFNLTHINTINLSYNSLAGQIPDKFDSFTSLTDLDLSYNQFSGSVPATILNNLFNCDISFNSNKISSIPWDQWTNSKALSNSSLSLSTNKLSGSLSYKIYWPKSIYLTSNAFTGPLPELNTTNGIPTITYLALGSNQLSGNLPVSLTQATYLATIYVTYNYQMSGQIPIQYASMPYLRNFQFYGTSLTCPQDNYNWDNFEKYASTSCPYHYSSYDHHDYIGWYIALFIGGIVFLLAIAGLVIFCALRSPRKIVIIE